MVLLFYLYYICLQSLHRLRRSPTEPVLSRSD